MGHQLTILAFSFLLTVGITPFAIPLLRKLKFGQSILEIGPSWHKNKSGTPTMGGIVFIVVVVTTILTIGSRSSTSLLLTCGAVAFGGIGFIDDYIKVVLKRNLGLRAWQKFSMQIIAAVAFTYAGLHIGIFDTRIYIPFTIIMLDLGAWFVPFTVFVILAATNSVNLTDGIDGLATSVTAVVMMFFIVMLRVLGMEPEFAFAILGVLLGFLVFNRNPAQVFMGDTGSLFLGGAVAGLAIILQNPLILLLIGMVYIAETASVIIQVIAFKLTGKRVFKMSPLHHHFEMCGWKEKKIVRVFSFVTIIGCVIAYLSLLR